MKGGILEQDVDRLSGEPARLHTGTSCTGLSQWRIRDCSRSGHESCGLGRGQAGELTFFEEDAGVVEGQAAVFEVEQAPDGVREVLFLGEAQ